MIIIFLIFSLSLIAFGRKFVLTFSAKNVYSLNNVVQILLFALLPFSEMLINLKRHLKNVFLGGGGEKLNYRET